MKILDKVNYPKDLKALSKDELLILVKEIYDFLVESVNKTGGHLGANLGVIELTIALHYVFDFSDQDDLLFDVGHQAYIHKILTGRKNQFTHLRKFNGISGYTNPSESPYDKYMFGHAGTALSVASGMVSIKTLKNTSKSSKTVVIVGDASIASGISFEAMNYLGEKKLDIIVILNDNSMSISKTVGQLACYFTKLRGSSSYQYFKVIMKMILNKLPYSLNNFLRNLFLQCTKIIKKTIYHGNLFQILNFDYYGPIDGHDLFSLMRLFESIKRKKIPILLHVITEKGKGLNFEGNKERFHAIRAVQNSENNKEDKEKKKKIISYTEAFVKSLIELAEEDPKIIALTAAMPSGTGLDKFALKFPDKFFDVGIAEQHLVAMASGMSALSWKPVCAIYSTFLQRAYDQVFQEVALNAKHVVFMLDRSGIVGEDGPSHAGIYDISYLRVFSNFILMAPRNSYELKQMLFYALYQLNQPVVIRYPRDNCIEAFESADFEEIKLGQYQVLKEGKDLILFAYGSMVRIALEVYEELESKGISVTVINARFAKPINKGGIMKLLEQKKLIFILEEHNSTGGLYSAFMETIIGSYNNNIPIYPINIKDIWVKHGERAEILSSCNLDTKSIVQYILKKI